MPNTAEMCLGTSAKLRLARIFLFSSHCDMLPLNQIIKVLQDYPELGDALNYEGLVICVNLLRILQPDLSLYLGPDKTEPPEHLPLSMHDFLKLSLCIEDETCKLVWKALREVAWDPDYDTDRDMKDRNLVQERCVHQ
ncbi:hypothetical protein HWV62_35097 [Athelia sp. TMB]|nr:hypothetical protein HWV62_35097 [Athelia sp. TMB]